MKQKKELHIVYIITKLELGGAQKVCLRLFNDMQSQSIKTTLIAGKGGILDATVKNAPNVFLLDSLHREISGLYLWQELKNLVQLVRLLRSLKKESLHIVAHTHSTKAGIVGRWAAFFAGIPTRIHTIHGYAFHEHQNKLIWFIIYCIELCTSFITTHFICVSSADVKKGIKLFPRFVKKHSIIRAAIDWDTFYIPARRHEFNRSSPFIFGTVACFKPQKNMLDLLKAFAQVHHECTDTHLMIIGDGTERQTIESWLNKNKLTNAVTLLGWQNEVVQHMQTWNAFVLSSLWEGLPCAIVEARMLKLPVISYDIGGIHDVIFHQYNGLLYKAKDWQGLASGMHIIGKNNQLYHRLRAYNDNLDDFHYAAMVTEHITLYRSLEKQTPHTDYTPHTA